MNPDADASEAQPLSVEQSVEQIARTLIGVARRDGAPPDVVDAAMCQALLLRRHPQRHAWVSVQDPADFAFMRGGADHDAVFADDDFTRPGYVVAVYTATAEFPLPRCYFRRVPVEHAMIVALGADPAGGSAGSRKPPLGARELFALGPSGDPQALVEAALQRQVDAAPEARDFFEGRGRNTRARGALVLRTGGCLRDGAVPTTMTSALVPVGRGAVSVAFELCAACIAAAPNVDLPDLNRAMSRFAYRGMIWADQPTPDEQLADAVEVVRGDLGCEVQTAEVRENGAFVRGVRPGGVRVELRVRHRLDYGYMLYDPAGTQRQRLDSADHHAETPHGPDHDHYDLRRGGKWRRASFLTGVPLLDVPALLAAVEALEAEPPEAEPPAPGPPGPRHRA